MHFMKLVVLALICNLVSVYCFSEDLCYFQGRAGDCVRYVPRCPSPESDDSAACRFLIANMWIQNQANSVPNGRSLIHVDATYALALATGFDPVFAYYISAYNEATDQVTYFPVDKCGKPIEDPRWISANIVGFDRVQSCLGGSDFHVTLEALPLDYPSRFPDLNLFPQAKGDHDDLLKFSLENGTSSGPLLHMRNWVLGRTVGGVLCTSGLTEPNEEGSFFDPFATNGCYCNGTHPADGICELDLVTREVALLGGRITSFVGKAGTKIFWYDAFDSTHCTTNNSITSDRFEEVIAKNPAQALNSGAHPWLAAMIGPYLHTTADSFSHYFCNLAYNPIYFPENGTFLFDQGSECDQFLHALRHYYETGHQYHYETTVAYLNWVYNELISLKTDLKIYRDGDFIESDVFNTDPNFEVIPREEIINKLLDAIFAVPPDVYNKAVHRLQKISEIIASYNFPQMPGYGKDYHCTDESTRSVRINVTFIVNDGVDIDEFCEKIVDLEKFSTDNLVIDFTEMLIAQSDLGFFVNRDQIKDCNGNSNFVSFVIDHLNDAEVNHAQSLLVKKILKQVIGKIAGVDVLRIHIEELDLEPCEECEECKECPPSSSSQTTINFNFDGMIPPEPCCNN